MYYIISSWITATFYILYMYKAPTCEFLVKLPKYLLKLHSTHLCPTLAGFDKRCLLLLRVPKHLERVYVALCNNLVGNLAKLKAQYLQGNRGKESLKRRFIFPYRYFCMRLRKQISSCRNSVQRVFKTNHPPSLFESPIILTSGQVKCHVIST